MYKNELKDYKFYRISTDINNNVFLEFRNTWRKSILLSSDILKIEGVSIYFDTTLYELFVDNKPFVKIEENIKKYILEEC